MKLFKVLYQLKVLPKTVAMNHHFWEWRVMAISFFTNFQKGGGMWHWSDFGEEEDWERKRRGLLYTRRKRSSRERRDKTSQEISQSRDQNKTSKSAALFLVAVRVAVYHRLYTNTLPSPSAPVHRYVCVCVDVCYLLKCVDEWPCVYLINCKNKGPHLSNMHPIKWNKTPKSKTNVSI